ncbi:MAG: hypothetical protein RLZZ283_214 [Candidatus Parcubacteria bacterium]|jgi:non-canonical (house-cleaning) NTP pyrophosphatase
MMKEVVYNPVTVVIGGVDDARFKAIKQVTEKRFPQGVLFRRIAVPVNTRLKSKTGFRAAESTVRTMVSEAHDKVPEADFVVAVDTRFMGETDGKVGPHYFERAVAMVKSVNRSKRGISRSKTGFDGKHNPTPADRHTQYVDALEKAFDRAK